MSGCFYGVGVGPGDPDLLTVKGLRLLTQSPVVLVPKRSAEDAGYAYGIVADLLDPERQEIVDLIFPMTRDFARLEAVWNAHVETIADHLNTGRDCVFITEGDPFLYSTFIYIWERLRARHPQFRTEVVPGVPSVTAAACRAELPLANGDDRIAIIPATYETGEIRRFLEDFDTVVFMKCNSVFPQLLATLAGSGLAGRAVYVKKATSPVEEVVHDLDSLAGRKLEYLSLLIVRREGRPRPQAAAVAGGCGKGKVGAARPAEPAPATMEAAEAAGA